MRSVKLSKPRKIRIIKGRWHRGGGGTQALYKHQGAELKSLKTALEQRDAQLEEYQTQLRQEHEEASRSVSSFQAQIASLKGTADEQSISLTFLSSFPCVSITAVLCLLLLSSFLGASSSWGTVAKWKRSNVLLIIRCMSQLACAGERNELQQLLSAALHQLQEGRPSLDGSCKEHAQVNQQLSCSQNSPFHMSGI